MDMRAEIERKIDNTRCPTCGVPLMEDVKVLWCARANCRETKQHWPTEAQMRFYKIGEREERSGKWKR